MTRRIAESAQCNQRVQHRRKHGRKTVAPLADSLYHPPFSFLKGPFAHWPPPEFRNNFQSVVGRRKKFRQAKKRGSRGRVKSLCSVPSGYNSWSCFIPGSSRVGLK